jgi:hypothetical protein
VETWDLWFPEAGATGLPFARGRLDPTDVLWVHAAPATLDVTVSDADGRVVARSQKLERTGERLPLTRLVRQGDTIEREDRWPTQADFGALVILCGGEVGRLVAWWNADDGSEWRWHLELYNHQ